MKIISSSRTSFAKCVLPFLWVGTVILLIAFSPPERILTSVIFGTIFVLAGIAVFVQIVWPLADIVEDCSDYLRVQRRGIEQRIDMHDIAEVDFFPWKNMETVTLQLRTAGPFGVQISFIPRYQVIFYPPLDGPRNAIAEDLRQRISPKLSTDKS
jgi:hypothetical protein